MLILNILSWTEVHVNVENDNGRYAIVRNELTILGAVIITEVAPIPYQVLTRSTALNNRKKTVGVYYSSHICNKKLRKMLVFYL